MCVCVCEIVIIKTVNVQFICRCSSFNNPVVCFVDLELIDLGHQVAPVSVVFVEFEDVNLYTYYYCRTDALIVPLN